MSMLAAFCLPGPAKEGRACFELRQVPLPTMIGLPPGSILIKSIALSICGSDLWGKGGDADWRKKTDYLRQALNVCGGTGHEALGEVVDVVEPCRFHIGQRVLAMSAAYIRAVDSMKATFEKETGTKADILPLQGAFAQYFVSHAALCISVPTSTDPPSHSLDFDPLWFVVAQPLGTLIHACKKLGSVMGMNIAIVGQGQNGLIMTQLIERLGAKRIIALDVLEERLECSKKLNATHTVISSTDPAKNDEIKAKIYDITDGKMCDVVIDVVGHQGNTIDLCASLTKDAGTVLLFGLPPAKDEAGFTIRSPDFRRNIKYVCSHSPDMETFELAVDFLRQGRFDPSLLFTHIIPFQQFPEAYEMVNSYKDGVIKIISTFD